MPNRARAEHGAHGKEPRRQVQDDDMLTIHQDGRITLRFLLNLNESGNDTAEVTLEPDDLACLFFGLLRRGSAPHEGGCR